MKNTIELLQQEIEKQSKIKLATEKERDAFAKPMLYEVPTYLR